MKHIVLILVLVLCNGQSFGQFAFEKNVKTQLFHRIENGQTWAVAVLKIQDGWHLYHDELGPGIGIPTKLKMLPLQEQWQIAPLPKPYRLEQAKLGKDGADTWVWSHKGTIIIYAKSKNIINNPVLEIKGLTCEDSGSCIPYADKVKSLGRGEDALFNNFLTHFKEIDSTKIVSKNKIAKDVVTLNWQKFTPQTTVKDRSVLFWIFLAFIAGIFLNVMPCVLPVVSLKVLSLVENAGKDKGAMFKHGLVFALGILAVFFVLAVLASSLGMGWGEQFQQPAFMIAMIAIIFAFALSLFGVFEMAVPTSINNIAAVKHEGYKDSFLKGVLTTLLATPCSGPFLGGTLAWALSQSTAIIFAVFMSLGLGMATPYVFLTSQPKLLSFLPKPGQWMVTFKQVTGFILLLTVIYLMFSLPHNMIIYTNVVLVFIGFASWYYGKYASFGLSLFRRIISVSIVISIISFGVWLAFVPLYNTYEQQNHSALNWQEFTPSSFKKYQLEGRSIFVDFTANWCPNCKFNEVNVFEHPEIVGLFKQKNVVIMKVDLTHNTKKSQQGRDFMQQLGGRSIPFMAVFASDKPLSPHIRFDLINRDDMSNILQSLP